MVEVFVVMYTIIIMFEEMHNITTHFMPISVCQINTAVGCMGYYNVHNIILLQYTLKPFLMHHCCVLQYQNSNLKVLLTGTMLYLLL